MPERFGPCSVACNRSVIARGPAEAGRGGWTRYLLVCAADLDRVALRALGLEDLGTLRTTRARCVRCKGAGVETALKAKRGSAPTLSADMLGEVAKLVWWFLVGEVRVMGECYSYFFG